MPYKNESDPELITRSAGVTQVFTQEFYAHLVALVPTPEVYRTIHENYASSYTALLAGNSDKAEEFEANRNAVYQGLAILHGLAKAVTIKDPTVSATLGLNTAASKTASAALSRPSGFRVTFASDGQPFASVDRVLNAKLYEVWGCDEDPNVETNWKLIASSTACKKIPLQGLLNRAKNNWLKIRGMRGKAETGPWSNFVNVPPAR
ncbi:hypothetical protein L4X63_04520 [Geomonas sp. Red32]|uniref:hypothetical protein n=1 Tax=Geomonas sp. Red32 TaxID=2912856 RepID=UPI00202D07F6|nr:hypothetical protein [Geomonas sp. Red32]MCM0080850.1 hypothetical protein [Geomonas sp. Red32]